MIIKNRYNETESSEELQATGFTIKASAEAFRFLSDRLYTDKPMAIVREIYTNAYDVHVFSKQDRSVEVHLPTYEEPFLSIKDFGCGLDEASIRGLYSTLFESTKRETNEQAGAIGIGRCAVLSYTDSFTVQSRYNGTIYTYNIFINNKGVPCVAKLSEEPTTEPNGLEVSCAVALGDINRFAEAARKFFARIPNLPKFNIEFAPDKINYSAEGEGWKARSTNYGEQSGLVAVVGPVAYPFTLPSGSVSSELHYLLSANLDLFFNIGEVDVAMSRESLSLDESTIDKIVTKLRQIHEQSIAKLEEELDKCPNIFRARKRLHEVSKQHGSLYYGARPSEVNYKGEPLKTLGTSVITKTVIAGIESNTGATLISTTYRRGRYVVNTDEISSLQAEKDYKFYVAPKALSRPRLKKYFDTNGGQIVFFRSDKPAAEVLESFGLSGESLLTSEDFPKAERGIRNITDKGLAPYLVLSNNSNDYAHADNWELPEDELDEEDEVVYVRMNRYGIGESGVPTGTVFRKANLIKTCGGPEIEIIGMRSKAYAEAGAKKNWIHFDEWFKREFAKLKDKAVVVATKYATVKDINYYTQRGVEKLPKEHGLRQMFTERNKYEHYFSLCSLAGVNVEGEIKYPLLSYIYSAPDEEIVRYIQDCDAKMLAESQK